MSIPGPGHPAPDLTLTDTHGQPFRLSSAWAKGPALLVFYPGDDTPVCTKQLCEYRDRWADFTALGVGIVGINPAPVARHGAFAARHGFPFPILADPDRACCRAYGAAGWFGTRRVAVLVDAYGVVRGRVATLPFLRPRADALLASLRELVAK